MVLPQAYTTQPRPISQEANRLSHKKGTRHHQFLGVFFIAVLPGEDTTRSQKRSPTKGNGAELDDASIGRFLRTNWTMGR